MFTVGRRFARRLIVEFWWIVKFSNVVCAKRMVFVAQSMMGDEAEKVTRVIRGTRRAESFIFYVAESRTSNWRSRIEQSPCVLYIREDEEFCER
jgi:hypothetical protein